MPHIEDLASKGKYLQALVPLERALHAHECHPEYDDYRMDRPKKDVPHLDGITFTNRAAYVIVRYKYVDGQRKAVWACRNGRDLGYLFMPNSYQARFNSLLHYAHLKKCAPGYVYSILGIMWPTAAKGERLFYPPVEHGDRWRVLPSQVEMGNRLSNGFSLRISIFRRVKGREPSGWVNPVESVKTHLVRVKKPGVALAADPVVKEAVGYFFTSSFFPDGHSGGVLSYVDREKASDRTFTDTAFWGAQDWYLIDSKFIFMVR